MAKISILLILLGLSVAIIYLSGKLEQKSWFRQIDRLLGIPVIAVLISWGVYEIISGEGSFFFINLKPLNNVTREQAPVLFWFCACAKFFFAFLFAVRVKQLYGKKTA